MWKMRRQKETVAALQFKTENTSNKIRKTISANSGTEGHFWQSVLLIYKYNLYDKHSFNFMIMSQ